MDRFKLPQYHSIGSYERTVKNENPTKIQDVETANLRLEDRLLGKYWSDGNFLPQHREFYEHLNEERYQHPDEGAPRNYPLHLKDERAYNNMVVKLHSCSKKEKRQNERRFTQSAVKLYKPAFLNSILSNRNRVKTTMLHPHSTLIEKIKTWTTSISMNEYISRKKMMNKLGFEDDDYYFLFLRNKEIAFQLIAESYPFTNRNGYITALRPENDELIEKKAKESKVPVCSRVESAEREINNLRLTSAQGGLFSFEYEQNMMHLVQQAHCKNWHVLLDISSYNPSDLPNNAFKKFTPDFVVSISPMLPQANFRYRSACLLVRKNPSHSIPE